jgi:hypothetical protein
VGTDVGLARIGNHGAKAFGLTAAPVTVKDSVKGILTVLNGLTMVQSGKFLNYDGTEMVW